MSSPLNDVLAGFSRKYRKKAKQVEPLIHKYLDEGMTPAQAVDKALKETDFKAYMTKAVKDAMLSSAVIGAGSYTAGKSTPLDEAWDPSGMTLSEKLHGTSKAMRNHIINTIKEQLKQGAHAMKSARTLYDGYNTTDNVVRKQMLPKYLQDVVNFSRRSDLGKNDVIALQKLVRKARRVVDRLAQNGAPNRALKTSYKELLDAVESCSDKALKRAIRTAVEEKSRYVAERIARTESARAWYQGFLKDTMDDPDVVAYRWVESTRHPTEDICDEYAKVDAYGLGPGIFPKDKAPELPAHPHCLCHYEKVYASEFVDKPELEQEYRIPQLGNEFSYFTHQGERFSTRRVMNSQYHIEVSDSVTLKPKMLHEMENQINESIKLMGIKDLNNFPTFVIGANNDLGGALGVYKPITNVLYINSDTLKRKAFAEYLKESKGAISANRLSTMIHELFHWKDAQEYIKRYGALTDQSRYIKKLCEQDEKKIDQLKAKGYNLYRISVYATRQLIMGRYDEVFTEYRTKILLKG